jgi:hypothetical protein
MDAIVGSQIRFKFSSAIAEAELVGGYIVDGNIVGKVRCFMADLT